MKKADEFRARQKARADRPAHDKKGCAKDTHLPFLRVFLQFYEKIVKNFTNYV